jgi:hypothetical protein
VQLIAFRKLVVPEVSGDQLAPASPLLRIVP